MNNNEVFTVLVITTAIFATMLIVHNICPTPKGPQEIIQILEQGKHHVSSHND